MQKQALCDLTSCEETPAGMGLEVAYRAMHDEERWRSPGVFSAAVERF